MPKKPYPTPEALDFTQISTRPDKCSNCQIANCPIRRVEPDRPTEDSWCRLHRSGPLELPQTSLLPQ